MKNFLLFSLVLLNGSTLCMSSSDDYFTQLLNGSTFGLSSEKDECPNNPSSISNTAALSSKDTDILTQLANQIKTPSFLEKNPQIVADIIHGYLMYSLKTMQQADLKEKKICLSNMETLSILLPEEGARRIALNCDIQEFAQIIKKTKQLKNFVITTAAKMGELATLKNFLSDNDFSLSAIIDEAFKAAFNNNQPKEVQLFLLSKSTTKGSLLRDACSHGPLPMVEILLEDDATTDVKNTLVNHSHILAANHAGHPAIAKRLQEYLVGKGYEYAGTIKLDQK